MIKHDYGLKQISIGLLVVLGIMLLTSCDKAEEPVVIEIEEIVVTPEVPAEAPVDDNKYTEDGRKLHTDKIKYQLNSVL